MASAFDDMVNSIANNPINNALDTMNEANQNSQFAPTSGSPVTPLSPEQLQQKINNIDGARYRAAKSLGDMSQVDPDTAEVAGSTFSDLVLKYGPEAASMMLDKFSQTESQYIDSATSSRSASEILGDTLSGVAQGIASIPTSMATAATAGLESQVNAITGKRGYEATEAVQGFSDAISNFFSNTLTSNARIAQRRAEEARAAYRDSLSEAQYQKDGSSVAKAGRDFFNGIINAFENPSKALETTANVGGSLGGAGLAVKFVSKGALAVSKYLPKFLGGMTEEVAAGLSAGASMEERMAALSQLTGVNKFMVKAGSPLFVNALAVGGEGVQGALQELDQVSNEELLTSSPVAKLYYDTYRQEGYSEAEARHLMRQKIQSNIVNPALLTGLSVGALSGKVMENIIRNPFVVHPGRGGFLGQSMQEGFEEGFETLPSLATNYAVQQNIDPNRRLTEGYFQELGSSMAAGAVGGAASAAPHTAARSILNKFLGSKNEDGEESQETVVSPSNKGTSNTASDDILRQQSEGYNAEQAKEYRDAMAHASERQKETSESAAETDNFSAATVSAGLKQAQAEFLNKKQEQTDTTPSEEQQKVTEETEKFLSNQTVGNTELTDLNAIEITEPKKANPEDSTGSTETSESNEPVKKVLTNDRDALKELQIIEDEKDFSRLNTVDVLGKLKDLWNELEQKEKDGTLGDISAEDLANKRNIIANLAQVYRNKLTFNPAVTPRDIATGAKGLDTQTFNELHGISNFANGIGNSTMRDFYTKTSSYLQQIALDSLHDDAEVSKVNDELNKAISDKGTKNKPLEIPGKYFGAISQLILTAGNFEAFADTFGKDENNKSTGESQRLNEVEAFIHTFTQAVKAGKVKLTADQQKIAKHAETARKLLREYKTITKKLNSLSLQGELANVSGEKLNSSAQVDEDAIKVSMALHLSRMYDALVRGDTHTFKAEQDQVSKFIESQRSKLVALSIAYAKASKLKDNSYNSRVSVGYSTSGYSVSVDRNNLNQSQKFGAILAHELAFMTNSYNTLVADALGQNAKVEMPLPHIQASKRNRTKKENQTFNYAVNVSGSGNNRVLGKLYKALTSNSKNNTTVLQNDPSARRALAKAIAVGLGSHDSANVWEDTLNIGNQNIKKAYTRKSAATNNINEDLNTTEETKPSTSTLDDLEILEDEDSEIPLVNIDISIPDTNATQDTSKSAKEVPEDTDDTIYRREGDQVDIAVDGTPIYASDLKGTDKLNDLGIEIIDEENPTDESNIEILEEEDVSNEELETLPNDATELFSPKSKDSEKENPVYADYVSGADELNDYVNAPIVNATIEGEDIIVLEPSVRYPNTEPVDLINSGLAGDENPEQTRAIIETMEGQSLLQKIKQEDDVPHNIKETAKYSSLFGFSSEENHKGTTFARNVLTKIWSNFRLKATKNTEKVKDTTGNEVEETTYTEIAPAVTSLTDSNCANLLNSEAFKKLPEADKTILRQLFGDETFDGKNAFDYVKARLNERFQQQWENFIRAGAKNKNKKKYTTLVQAIQESYADPYASPEKKEEYKQNLLNAFISSLERGGINGSLLLAVDPNQELDLTKDPEEWFKIFRVNEPVLNAITAVVVQELYNAYQRRYSGVSSAIEAANLKEIDLLGVNFKKLNKEYTDTAFTAGVLENIDKKVRDILGIRPASTSTLGDSMLMHSVLTVVSLFDEAPIGDHRVVTVTNASMITDPDQEVQVFKFRSQDEEAKHPYFAKPAGITGSPTDSLYKALGVTKEQGINIGEKGLKNLKAENNEKKRLRSPDTVSDRVAKVCRDREEVGYTFNKEIHNLFTKVFNIDSLCKITTGYTAEEVKKAKEAYAIHNGSLEPKDSQYFNIPNISRKDLDQIVANHLKFNPEHLEKLESAHSIFTVGESHMEDVLAAMVEAYNQDHPDAPVASPEDFLELDKSIQESYAQHYAFQVTKANRLQTVNVKASPISNKLVREILTALPETLIKNTQLNAEHLSTDPTSEDFSRTLWLLSLAQASGVKLWKKHPTKSIKSFLKNLATFENTYKQKQGEYKNTLNLDNLYEALKGNSSLQINESTAELLRDSLSSAGIDITPQMLVGLSEIARAKAGEQVKSSMYLEIDARSSGPANIAARFPIGSFITDADVRIMESTGVLFDTLGQTFDAVTLRESLAKDLYETNSSRATKVLNYFRETFFTDSKEGTGVNTGKRAKVGTKELSNSLTDKVLAWLLPEQVEINSDGSFKEFKRAFIKDYSTQKTYAAGVTAITKNLVVSIFNSLEAKLTSVLQDIDSIGVTPPADMSAKEFVLREAAKKMFPELEPDEAFRAQQELFTALRDLYSFNTQWKETNGKKQLVSVLNKHHTLTSAFNSMIYDQEHDTDTANGGYIKKQVINFCRGFSSESGNIDTFVNNAKNLLMTPVCQGIDSNAAISTQETKQNTIGLFNGMSTLGTYLYSLAVNAVKHMYHNVESSTQLSENQKALLKSLRVGRLFNEELSFHMGQKGDTEYKYNNTLKRNKNKRDASSGIEYSSKKNKRKTKTLHMPTDSTQIFGKEGTGAGVGQQAITVQSAGDAEIILQLATLLRDIGLNAKAEMIFDGINLTLDTDMQKVIDSIGSSVKNSYRQNIYASMLVITNSVIKFLNKKPVQKALFDKTNPYAFTGKYGSQVILSVLASLYNVANNDSQAAGEIADLLKDVAKGEDITLAPAEIMDYFQAYAEDIRNKAIDAEARIASMHGLREDIDNYGDLRTDYKVQENSLKFPWSSNNMDPLGYADFTYNLPFEIDYNGQHYVIKSVKEWNDLEPKLKASFRSVVYDQNRDIIARNSKAFKVVQTQLDESFQKNAPKNTSKEKPFGTAAKVLNMINDMSIFGDVRKHPIAKAIHQFLVPLATKLGIDFNKIKVYTDPKTMPKELREQLEAKATSQGITDVFGNPFSTTITDANGEVIEQIIFIRTKSKFDTSNAFQFFHELSHCVTDRIVDFGEVSAENSNEGQLYKRLKNTTTQVFTSVFKDLVKAYGKTTGNTRTAEAYVASILWSPSANLARLTTEFKKCLVVNGGMSDEGAEQVILFLNQLRTNFEYTSERTISLKDTVGAGSTAIKETASYLSSFEHLLTKVSKKLAPEIEGKTTGEFLQKIAENIADLFKKAGRIFINAWNKYLGTQFISNTADSAIADLNTLSGSFFAQLHYLGQLSESPLKFEENSNVRKVRGESHISQLLVSDNLVQKLTDPVLKYVNNRINTDKYVRAKMTNLQKNMNKSLEDAGKYGFNLSDNQKEIYRLVYMASSLGMKGDTNTGRELNHMVHKILDLMKGDTFTPENRRDNPIDTQIGLRKYRLLRGFFKPSSNDPAAAALEREQRLIPTFVALAAVDPQLNRFLADIQYDNKVPFSSENSAEQAVVRGIKKVADSFGKVVDNLSNKKNRNGQELIDTYINMLTENDSHKSRYNAITKGAFAAMDAVDKTGDKLDQQIIKVANKARTKIKQYSKSLKDSGFPVLSEVAKAVYNVIDIGDSARILNRASGNKVGLAEEIHLLSMNLSNRFPVSWISGFMREYINRSRITDAFLTVAKAAKTSIDWESKQYKEKIPASVKALLNGMSEEERASLTRTMIKCDLTALNRYRGNMKDFADLVQNIDIDKRGDREITQLKSALRNILPRDINENHFLDTAIDNLSTYMVTGKFNTGSKGLFYRNSDIILHTGIKNQGINPKRIDAQVLDRARGIIDEMIALKALQKVDTNDRAILAKRLGADTETASNFMIVFDNIAQRNEKDREALIRRGQLFNRWQGYTPSVQTNSTSVIVIPDYDIQTQKRYALYGYTRKDVYETSPADNMGAAHYWVADYNTEATFIAGALGNISLTAGGINILTGYSHNSIVAPIVGTNNKNAINEFNYTSKQIASNGGAHPLVPVFNSKGEITGYERTNDIDHNYGKKFDEDIATVLGEWCGRQFAEEKTIEGSRKVIEELKRLYEEDDFYREGGAYINLLNPRVYKKDPVVREAVEMLQSNSELMNMISEVWGEKDTLMVRKDMISQIVGQRRASIADLWVGRSRLPESVQTVLKTALNRLSFGSAQWLVKAEKMLQGVTATAKHSMIVRNLEVVQNNAFANMLQLNMLGVPASDIASKIPRIVKDCEDYLKYLSEIADINVALASKDLSQDRRKGLESAKLARQASITNLSIYPLIDSGEFNSINDATVTRTDLNILQGNLGDLFEQQIENLPESIKSGAKQLVVTKDTALYQLLAKATQYGDFVAKVILYEDRMQNQKLSQEEALYQARSFFVDYDFMPSRTRDYAESIGLLWFYNFKLRICKVMTHIITNNPARALALTVGGYVGKVSPDTPIKDSFIGRLLGFGPSLAYTSVVGAPGMFITGLLSNPWLMLLGIVF